MRAAIGADDWESIRLQRLDLEQIDRRDLIHQAGQDKHRRAAEMLPAQSTSRELPRDDEVVPRRRVPAVAALEEASTPKASSNKMIATQEMIASHVGRSPRDQVGE